MISFGFDPVGELKIRLIEQFCSERYETNLAGLKGKFTEAEDRKRVNLEFREWLKAVTLR